MARSYQYFIAGALSEVQEDVELQMTIASLAEGKYKYEAKIVKGRISSDKNKYPDILWLRYNKGQLHPEPWSMETIREVDPIPPEFM